MKTSEIAQRGGGRRGSVINVEHLSGIKTRPKDISHLSSQIHFKKKSTSSQPDIPRDENITKCSVSSL